VHAKWVFVLLAIVFALSFAFLGVGTGTNGIGDILQNIFSYGGGGASLSSLEHKTQNNPKDAAAWLALANKAETKNKLDEAISAYQSYTRLRPKDQSALVSLSSLYQRRAQDFINLYESYQAQNPPFSQGSPFEPDPNSPLGKAFQDPKLLLHPIENALALALNVKATAALDKLSTLKTDAEGADRKLVALNPKDASNQLQLAEIAQAANDNATAKTAYEAFLKLAPDDSQAPFAKKQLKAVEKLLAGTATAPATGG
jgi:predicted Zn-dependent protease